MIWKTYFFPHVRVPRTFASWAGLIFSVNCTTFPNWCTWERKLPPGIRIHWMWQVTPSKSRSYHDGVCLAHKLSKKGQVEGVDNQWFRLPPAAVPESLLTLTSTFQLGYWQTLQRWAPKYLLITMVETRIVMIDGRGGCCIYSAIGVASHSNARIQTACRTSLQAAWMSSNYVVAHADCMQSFTAGSLDECYYRGLVSTNYGAIDGDIWDGWSLPGFIFKTWWWKADPPCI